MYLLTCLLASGLSRTCGDFARFCPGSAIEFRQYPCYTMYCIRLLRAADRILIHSRKGYPYEEHGSRYCRHRRHCRNRHYDRIDPDRLRLTGGPRGASEKSGKKITEAAFMVFAWKLPPFLSFPFLTGSCKRPAPALLPDHFIILGRMTAVCSGISSVISSSLPYFFTFFCRSTKPSTVPITL